MTEPVQYRILQTIALMLLDIKKSNNYYFDMGQAQTEEVSIEDIREFPAVNVLMGPVDYLTGRGGSEAGRLVKTLNITLDTYIRGEEDKQLYITRMLADLEIRFGNDTVNGSTAYNQEANAWDVEGEALATIFTSALPFSVDSEKHLFGVEFQMQIKYRQDRNDPTVMYN